MSILDANYYRKERKQENGIHGLNSGKYTDISDFDDSGEMLVMPRGMCTAALPTEQKTPRFLALMVGCRNKEKIKESALPVNSKKKAKWAVRILAD